MTDLAHLVRTKLTIQLESRMRDLEASMFCTVFLPTEGGIVKETQIAGRDYNNLVTNRPDRDRGSPHVWTFNAMLEAIVERLGSKATMIPADRGKLEALRTLGQLTEVEQLSTLGEWIKSCRHLPTYPMPGQPPRAHHVRVQVTRLRARVPRRGSGRGILKEKDHDSGLGQALAETTRGARYARESSAREDSKPPRIP